MDNILEVSHVTKEYRERKRERIVLEDISFSLVKGEMLGIAGSSGCGKSTLLHVAAGMEVPDRGKISYTEEIRNIKKETERPVCTVMCRWFFRNRRKLLVPV